MAEHNHNDPYTTPILNILIKMKNQGKSDSSIIFVDKALTIISKNANINNPEEVIDFIATKTVSNGYKKNLCIAYNRFCRYHKIKWTMPHFAPDPRPIKIPTKEKTPENSEVHS